MKKISLIVMSLSVILTGCTLLNPVRPKPPQNHLIDSWPSDISHYKQSDLILMVIKPTTESIYDTKQMIYSTQAHKVNAYSYNEWAATPGEMVEPLIAETLQKTGYFKAVLTPPHVGKYNYALSTQVFELYQDYTQKPPVLILTLNAQISEGDSDKIIASKSFSVRQPILGDNPDAAVISANEANKAIMTKLAKFTISTLQKASASQVDNW